MLPPGVRDFVGEKRRKLLSIIEEVFRLYGYRYMETPALEYLSTLTEKGGEEIKEQIFYCEKEGLRFDHTVPLMRYVRDHPEIPKPFKRYAIGKVWRNEEPQKMRYREFVQADVDIIGVKEIWASQELLEIAEEVFRRLEIQPIIRVNHKAFLLELAKDIEDKGFFFRTLDKIDRFGKDWVKQELEKKGIDGEIVDRLSKMTLEDVRGYSEKAYEDLKVLGRTFDPFLVRGLDYYTGELFEFGIEGVNVSVGGGGRYDGMFGSDYNVGISFGVDRIYDIWEKEFPPKGLFIAWIKEKEFANEAASFFRRHNIPTELNLQERSLKKQLEYASKHYRWVAIIGPKEAQERKITLRDLAQSKEETLNLDEALKKVS